MNTFTKIYLEHFKIVVMKRPQLGRYHSNQVLPAKFLKTWSEWG